MKKIITICLMTVMLGVGYARAGTWTTLDMPGATGTYLYGISGSNIVGEYVDASGNHGCLYNGTSWITLNMPGVSLIHPRGISGSTIVGYYNEEPYPFYAHGFFYNGTSWTILNAPTAYYTYPNGIDGNNIVGECGGGGDTRGFLYNGANWTLFQIVPGASNNSLNGIDGSNIIGYYSYYSVHGCFYDGTSWTTLDMPGAVATKLFGISGSIMVGRYWDYGDHSLSCLYDGTTWTTLDYPGASWTWLSGIDGNNIVGYYGDASGVVHGFIYTVSEPPVEYTLTVNITGFGTVAKNPAKATYHYGDMVELTAHPNTGWQFSAWGGDLTGSENPKTVTIDGSKTVTATFTQTVVSAKVYYPSGMVGYWKFDGSLIDELGIYNGTMGYYGSYADGIINQGLHGARGCSNPFAAKVDNFPNLDSFTIEAWIKPACPPGSWTDSLTVAKWAGGYGGTGFILFTAASPWESSNYIFLLAIEEGPINTTATSPLTYPCDNWYHVVAMRDKGNVLKLFVNGEEVASVLDNVVGSIANTMPLTFHGYVGGGCGWGMGAITMDEVAIYDRALTLEEIQQHYQNGLNGLGYEIVVIAIDIKPGNVPVAILGSATLDVTTVDQSTVEFAGAHPLPNYCSQLGRIPEDVDGDGLLDIVFYFKIQDLNLPPGDTKACLTGRTSSGQEFRGCESVCRLGPVVGDLNNDRKIDFEDFAIFASRWLECTDPNCG